MRRSRWRSQTAMLAPPAVATSPGQLRKFGADGQEGLSHPALDVVLAGCCSGLRDWSLGQTVGWTGSQALWFAGALTVSMVSWLQHYSDA
jgi:hypothetical protein